MPTLPEVEKGAVFAGPFLDVTLELLAAGGPHFILIRLEQRPGQHIQLLGKWTNNCEQKLKYFVLCI